MRNKENSRELCIKAGGFLPKPMDEQENNYLMNLTAHSFFIGINDEKTESLWVYDGDEKPVQWTDWVDGEPNSPTGDCALILTWAGDERGWFDDNCKGNLGTTVICERNGKFKQGFKSVD